MPSSYEDDIPILDFYHQSEKTSVRGVTCTQCHKKMPPGTRYVRTVSREDASSPVITTCICIDNMFGGPTTCSAFYTRCPDCQDGLALGPEGNILYEKGDPVICRTCNGQGQLPKDPPEPKITITSITKEHYKASADRWTPPSELKP